MEKEDNAQKSGREHPEGKVKCDKEQYERLLRCSEKKDITEWNEWCLKHLEEEIWLQKANLRTARLENANLVAAHLENADLMGAHLENADLGYAHLENAKLNVAHLESANLSNAHLENADLRYAHLDYIYLGNAHLENANLSNAHLENAELNGTHLENAELGYAHLKGANLTNAHLENAHLKRAHLENADLRYAHLENTELERTYLQGATFRKANLQNTNFTDARLQGTILSKANLKGAKFETVIVDGETVVWKAQVDRKTNFSGAGLANVRIDPETKQLLEYNIRRMNWEVWYKEHFLMQWPVKLFWSFSNYGLSTWRIILTFLALSIIFATVYFVWGAVDYYLLGIKDEPGVVRDLFVKVATKEQISELYYSAMIYLRSLYFSIVTMTTLGFGDMYANATRLGCRWWAGHLFLMVQVILGYVLLGALVTRFAVLFSAGGPAGTFSPSQTKETGEDKKHNP